jgi:KipI family sensor histidine kinase inhibitor
MRFVIASDSSVLAVAGDEISETVNSQVVGLFLQIQTAAPEWLENLHPAYASLLIDFDPRRTGHQEVINYVKSIPSTRAAVRSSKLVELSVRYDGEDVKEVAQIHQLTIENLIRLHSSADYRVAFLGFMPGFAYLLGLPDALVTPRRTTPRLRVPAGSVAIGGGQTGVYPTDSPGGWRIIGRVLDQEFPLSPEWVTPGDRVRFIPA